MIDSEFRAIRHQLEHVDLPARRSHCEPDALFGFAYFPNEGLIPIVVVLANGRTVEAGLIGKEGIVGLPSIAGRQTSPLRGVIQISGKGASNQNRSPAKDLGNDENSRGALKRYASVLAMQIAQTAACNRLHDVNQRLARWVAMALDRVGSESLCITHEYLATKLDTDRSSISLAASDLQNLGIIKYNRGVAKVLDREKLEMAACECYRVIRAFDEDHAWPRQRKRIA